VPCACAPTPARSTLPGRSSAFAFGDTADNVTRKGEQVARDVTGDAKSAAGDVKSAARGAASDAKGAARGVQVCLRPGRPSLPGRTILWLCVRCAGLRAQIMRHGVGAFATG
jgi:hypothetical protein